VSPQTNNYKCFVLIKENNSTCGLNKEPLLTDFAKTESMSECFVDDFSTRKSSNSQVSASDFGISNSNEEDTDSFGIFSDGDENELANEIKSRNEADDELASLFAEDEPEPSRRLAAFARPCNPIVRDRRFTMARCLAPSLEEQPMRCFSSIKSNNYILGQGVA
jgi:hypothetical protein